MNTKNKIIISVLSIMAISAHAQTAKEQLRSSELQHSSKPSSVQQDKSIPSYGTYILQPELIAVPQSLADRRQEHHNLANVTLVTAPDPQPVTSNIRKNAVVLNKLTGQQGVVTGNLSLLLKEHADLQDLLQQFDLKVVKSAPETRFYIVQPNTTQDLLPLIEQLKLSGSTEVVRLDILENKYSNQ